MGSWLYTVPRDSGRGATFSWVIAGVGFRLVEIDVGGAEGDGQAKGWRRPLRSIKHLKSMFQHIVLFQFLMRR
jgi:hypothetical protein